MKNEIGVDEVGYGSWAGPLVICALQFKESTDIVFADSKSLTPKKREELFEILKKISIYKIAMGNASEINKYGLAQVYKETLLEAVAGFSGEIFLDGRKPKYLECTAIIKGDSKVQCISAASIVAKVFRDNLMSTEISQKFPQYGFEIHKGYGTKAHIEAIGKYGLCAEHRSVYNLSKYLYNIL